jgi:FecR protein
MKQLLSFVITLLVLSGSLSANETFGSIVKYEGDVSIKRAGSDIRQKVEKSNMVVFENDIIHTGANSTAYMRLQNKSQIILKSNTEFKVNKVDEVRINRGSGLFNILRRTINKHRRRFKIKTATCILGVKGTKYMVKLQEKDTRVYLKTGKLTIESATSKYLKYHNKMEDEFQAATRKAEKEFQDFKKQAEDEYTEMVESFDLVAGQAIDVSGEDAKPIPFTPEIISEFEAFASY